MTTHHRPPDSDLVGIALVMLGVALYRSNPAAMRSDSHRLSVCSVRNGEMEMR